MTLMTAPSTSQQRRSPESGWPADALPEAWISTLFEKMTTFYGSKFLDMWRGTDMSLLRRMWALELAQLTNAELKRGSSALIGRPFPPTLPEFVLLCRPKVNLDAALEEAMTQMTHRANGAQDTWTDPAFYWAAAKIGFWDMQQLPRDALLKRFAAALDDVRRGPVPPVPPVPMQLAPPSGPAVDRATAEASHAKVKAHCAAWARKATSGTATDGLRWAYRIAEKVKRGEPVNHTVESFAREALEQETKRHATF